MCNTRSVTIYKRILRASAIITLSGAVAGGVSAGTIDLSNFVHGEILNTQIPGVTITAENIGGGPDIAAIFDTRLSGTRDPDLEGPAGTPWTGGNLGNANPNLVIGNAIILAENGQGKADGILNFPDDEGSRAAGTLAFAFANNISSIGFDLIDIETVSASHPYAGITFDDGAGGTVNIAFNGLLTRTHPIFGAPSWDGDNSINRILPYTAADVGLSHFRTVSFHLGGSAAITNISVSVPDATTSLWLVLAGLSPLGWIAARFRPSSRS